MNTCTIRFPEGYDSFSWEHEIKGWLGGVSLCCAGEEYQLIFYSPERLSQEINDELAMTGFFFETNLIVIPNVNRECIEEAVGRIVSTGQFKRLIAVSRPGNPGDCTNLVITRHSES